VLGETPSYNKRNPKKGIESSPSSRIRLQNHTNAVTTKEIPKRELRVRQDWCPPPTSDPSVTTKEIPKRELRVKTRRKAPLLFLSGGLQQKKSQKGN
jgi:hypothetical protein